MASAREGSQWLLGAAIAGIAGLAAIRMAGLHQHGPRRDGVGPGGPNRWGPKPDRWIADGWKLGGTPGTRRRRPRPDGLEPDGVPVRPDRPSGLSGGAAAALEFDE